MPVREEYGQRVRQEPSGLWQPDEWQQEQQQQPGLNQHPAP